MRFLTEIQPEKRAEKAGGFKEFLNATPSPRQEHVQYMSREEGLRESREEERIRREQDQLPPDGNCTLFSYSK